MNRYSRSNVLTLLVLVVSITYFSAGCAISSRTALPELPPVPVLTITTASVVSPGFTNTIYPPPDGGPDGGQIITTSGGTPPLSSCTIVNDTPTSDFDQLPPGLTIMPTGTTNCIIVGTIADTAPLGIYTFTVRAADARGTSATRSFTIEVRVGFLLNAATLGNAKELTTFGPLNLPTTGGTVPGNLANCSVSNGPAGLTASVSGRDCVLNGAPANGSAGSYPNFTVTATDQGSAGSNSLIVPLVVNDDLAVTTTTLPNVTVNMAYNQTLTNSGGQMPFMWSIASGPFTGGTGNAGTPCEGFTLDAGTGVISGTAVNAGACSFTAQVDDTATSSTTSNGTFVTTVSTNATQALTITVDKSDTTTVITSDTPDPSVADQDYTVNVSVTAVSAGATMPTGTVTVTDGTDSCAAPITLTPGNPSTGSCQLTSTVVGAKMLTATYAGDSNFNGSDNTGAPEPHQVNTRSTSTTVSLNPTSVAVNQPSQVTVTVTDTEVNGTASSPGGTVVINTSDGTDTIGTCTLAAGAPGTSTCTANVTPTQLGAGSRSITANFTATDNKHADSNSTATPQTLLVTARTTSTVVMLSPAAVFVNQGTTVTVTVSDTDVNPPASAPGGTIVINSSDGTDTIGACALAPSGPSASQCTATLTPTVVGAGSRSITASYTATDGDHANSDSTGAPQTLTVNPRTTTSTVVLTPNTVLVSETSTITVTVVDTAGAGTATTPFGNVSFVSTVGTDTFTGACMLAETVPGTASCNAAMVTANMVAGGTHGITANFTATDSVHADSSGNANLTVNARSTSTSVSLLQTTVVVGETSTATVTITDTSGTGTPSAPGGTVAIVSSVGSDVIGVCTLAPTGPATSTCAAGVTPQMVAGGTHNITATFVATDDIHADSNSNASPQALTVNPRTTTTALAITGTPIVFVNESTTVAVTVSDSSIAGSPFVPGGTITLASTVVTDVFSACTLAPPPGPGVSATCNATVTPQMVAGGIHNLTASYTPSDDVHTASDSTATPQPLTVNPRTTATTVVLNPTTVSVNEPTSVMVTVMDTTPNPTPVSPGGTIVINTSDGTDNITACTLAASGPGVSTCTAALTPTTFGGGSRMISASYTATDDVHTNSDSTATPQTLTVTARSTTTTVAFSLNPVVFGQTVDVMVTVADTSPGTASQPGVGDTVTVTSSGASDVITGTCMLAGATASTSTCTVQLTADLPTGPHTVTATFAGSGVHLGSTGNSDLTVNLRTTTTAVTFAKSPIIVGEQTDVTVTVTDTAPGTTSTPGVGTMVTVMSSVGTDVLSSGTCTLAETVPNTAAACTVQITPAQDGTVHTVTGNFSATAVHAASSGMGDLTVNGRPTTTAVVLTSGTVAVNQSDTATVTVTDTGAFGTQTSPGVGDTITFMGETGDAFGTCTLAVDTANSSTCSASVTPSQVGDGTHTITAMFNATTVHATSTSAGADLTVNLRTTTTTLALTAGTATVDDSDTMTVTVTDTDDATTQSSPGVGDTITFMGETGDTFGTCTLAAATANSSTCSASVTPTELGDGTHTITATFNANAVHDTSTSAGADLTVNLRTTTTTLALTAGTATVNASDTMTVTVTDTSAGGTQSSPGVGDTITFMGETGDTFGTCTLAAATANSSSCSASVTPTEFGDGTHTLTGMFSATSKHDTSTSAGTDLTVVRRQTTTAVAFSQNPASAGGTTTVTATVMDTDVNGTAVTPAAMVTFSSDDAGDAFSGGGMCTLVETVPGTASCSVTLTASATTGTHMITGTFPDTNVHATSNNTQSLTVQAMVLATFTLGDATEGRTVTDVDLPISGGTGPYTCVSAGGPTGITVTAVGSVCRISGAPDPGQAGSYTLMITAQDSGVNMDSQSSSLNVSAPLAIDQDVGMDNAETLPDGVTTMTYSLTFTASGGQTPRTFSEVAGTTLADDADCTGLTFNTGTGGLSGNTNGAASSTCTFTIRSTDTATTAMVGGSTVPFSPSANYDVALTLNIDADLVLTNPDNTAKTVVNALNGSAYTGDTFTATGGRLAYTFSITTPNFTCAAGTCTGNTGSCTGFALDQATGAFSFSGTPGTVGTCTFDAQVTDTGSSALSALTRTATGVNLYVLDTFSYVADSGNNQVNVVNTTTDTETTTISLNAIGASRGPNTIAIRRDGTRAYVTLETSSELAVIDTTSNSLLTGQTVDLSTVATCTGPRAIAIGTAGNAEDRAYIACTNDSVAIFDVSGASPSFLRTIALTLGPSSDPFGIDVSPDGSLVHIAASNSRSSRSIATNADVNSETVTTTGTVFPVGTDNRRVLFSQDGSEVYFTDVGSPNNVHAVVAATPNGATTTDMRVFTGLNPLRMTRDPGTGRVFVGMSGTGQLNPDSGGTGTTTGFFMPIEANATAASKQITVGNNNADRASGVTTITFTSQPFVDGDIISVSGMSTADFDGIYVVQNAQTNSFDYPQPGRSNNTNEQGATIVLLASAGTTAVNGITTPPTNTKVYSAITSNVSRRNDTSPFASAGANISLTGSGARAGMTSIPIPK